MSRFETPGCSRCLVRALAGGAAFALLSQFSFGLVGTAGYALAQSAPVISNNPSVIVDLSVLEALGGGPVRFGASAPASDATLRGPIESRPLDAPVGGSASSRTTAASVANSVAPAPLQAPAAAPRSRLNAAALAALGLDTQVAPPPPPVAVQPPPAPPAVAAVPQRRPAPAAPPAPAATTVRVTPPPPAPPAAAVAAQSPPAAPVRRATTVPAPPVLPEAPVVRAAPEAREAPTASTAPAPPVETAVTAPAPETQTARVAPTLAADSAADSAADGPLSIAFNEGSAVLPDEARRELDGLVAAMTSDSALKVQLRAYAAGTSDTTSQARRLSLSRALAVRSFLIENGVQTTRMDVRALGNKSGDGPADRVDVVMVDQ